MFANLALARGDGRYARLQRTLARVHLLILDDWGLEPLDDQARHDLLEILEDRYGRRSTLITSNLPFDEWTETFGSERLTGALLDRITHHVNILEMNGDSYRLAQSRARKAG